MNKTYLYFPTKIEDFDLIDPNDENAKLCISQVINHLSDLCSHKPILHSHNAKLDDYSDGLFIDIDEDLNDWNICVFKKNNKIIGILEEDIITQIYNSL